MKYTFFIQIMASFCHFCCCWFKRIASNFSETIEISQTRIRIDSGTHKKTTVSYAPRYAMSKPDTKPSSMENNRQAFSAEGLSSKTVD